MPGIYELVDALPSVVVGMVALWISGSTVHWFFRTCVVGVGLLLLLLIPAYELVIAFVTEVLVVVSGMAIWRLRRGDRNAKTVQQPNPSWRPQFSLKTILMLTLVVAVIMSVAVSFPSLTWQHWTRWIGIGTTAGLITLFCAWLVLGTARRRTRVLAAAFGIPAIAYGMSGCEFLSGVRYWTGLVEWFLAPQSQTWMWNQSLHYAGTLLIAVPVLCSWICLLIRAGWFVPLGQVSGHNFDTGVPWRTPRVRWLAFTYSVCIAALPLYLIWRLFTPTPIPEDPISLPSSYKHLIAAGNMIGTSGRTRLRQFWNLSTKDLQKEIEEHYEALVRLRQGFANSTAYRTTVENDSKALDPNGT